MAETIRTTCPYCGVGCGVEATVEADGRVSIAGDETHPANRGRLCSKGSALGQTFGDETRLLSPVIDGETASWDSAISLIAEKFGTAARERGPQSVAAYLSGQMLTEDYYVANKLFKGFLGSANVDTNSRLCMASAVAAHVRSFGEDIVPIVYDDLEEADLVVLVGSNLAWCHPVLHQRLLAARKARGTKIVVIDPRRTASCEAADLHLPIRPGRDVLLFNGLLTHFETVGALDRHFINAHVAGFDAAMAAARASAPDVLTVADGCGLPIALVERFYALFSCTKRVVTAFSQGVNQSTRGVDKANAIINVHLATGRIGRAGAGPFSVTGQPNAMGGREVGGLATQLAAHMSFADPKDVDRVRRFWAAPHMATKPGLKAVDLFRKAADGEIDALWVMATNPAVSLPDAGLVRAALERCPFVVLSDCYRDTDTAAFANVLLPATGWGEKDGTVTNSDRTISRQRALKPPTGDARADWAALAAVGRAMGFDAAFDWPNAAAVFREHAALSGFENDGRRLFDISALQEIEDDAYEALEPQRWPLSAHCAPAGRLFADGGFPTADGRAITPPVLQIDPENPPSADYPLILNTGRYRDQWHTMTRTGLAARLSRHRAEPLLEIHPEDAIACGLVDGGFADLESPWGEARFKVKVTSDQAIGQVFAPMHWSQANAAAAGIGPVVNPATDALSGQPESKHTPCRAKPWRPERRGFAVCRSRFAPPTGYWVRWRGEGDAQIYELAGSDAEFDQLAETLGAKSDEHINYADAALGVTRRAWLRQGGLSATLYAAPTEAPNARERLIALLSLASLSPMERAEALAGRAAKAGADPGPIVCACASVGANLIVNAIATGEAVTVEALGAALNAGATCGACRPELEAMIDATRRDIAA